MDLCNTSNSLSASASQVLTVQLNLRKLLENQERPSMNIICQKVGHSVLFAKKHRRLLCLVMRVSAAFFFCCSGHQVATEGMTRFEDRRRLPLGVSVNLTSFAAKILTHVSLLLPAAALNKTG
jgi:hypothetical protein